MNRLMLIGAMAVILAGAAAVQHGNANPGGPILHKADDIEWAPGPPSLPAGAEFVVLEGDPTQTGIFTMRLRVPAGYRIPPHTHPKVERVTVLSGTLKLGMQETFDPEAATSLKEGSYFSMPPGMVHFAFTEAETVVQLTSTGPWEIHYLNPADDPRL